MTSITPSTMASTMPSTAADSTGKKKEKEILVIKDEAEFKYRTGDVYSGEFEVKKKDKIFKMNGNGVYRTHEGDIYTALWEYDKISPSEYTTVQYHDGSKYYGTINNWNYAGPAEYTYPDGSVLNCSFNESCPLGNVELTDLNSHKWFGTTELGYAWLTPYNHYYEYLESTRPPKARKKKGSPASNVIESKYV